MKRTSNLFTNILVGNNQALERSKYDQALAPATTLF